MIASIEAIASLILTYLTRSSSIAWYTSCMYIFWIAAVLMVAIGTYAVLVVRTLRHSIAISKLLIEKGNPFEQHPQSPMQHILVAGDSTAVGVGTSDNRNSIAGRIGTEYPESDITNIAVSGARLADLEKRLDALHEQAAAKHDLVFLLIGANDITHFTSCAAMRAQLTRILAVAEQIGKQTILLTAGDVGLSPAFKWPLSRIMTMRTLETRVIFTEEIAKRHHVRYVDLYHEAKDEIFNTDVERYYAPDHFHPSDDGYGIWYAKIKEVIGTITQYRSFIPSSPS